MKWMVVDRFWNRTKVNVKARNGPWEFASLRDCDRQILDCCSSSEFRSYMNIITQTLTYLLFVTGLSFGVDAETNGRAN
jgi:hypothetical protein